MDVNYVYLLPIVIFVWFPATFIVTYVMAVLRKDVNPIFPYISDTGTFSPESCIFGQMINTGAILMGLFVYVRYRQVREICDRNHLDDSIRQKNQFSTWFGFIATFGVTVVGNFQETNLLVVHMLGAFLAFGLGTIWQCLQTWVSFKLPSIVMNARINNLRLVLSVVSSVSFLVSFVFGGLALLRFKGEDITKWNKEDGGYDFHLTSTVTEWIVVFCMMSFIVSFAQELRTIQFEEPSIKFIEAVNNTQSIPTLATSHIERF